MIRRSTIANLSAEKKYIQRWLKLYCLHLYELNEKDIRDQLPYYLHQILSLEREDQQPIQTLWTLTLKNCNICPKDCFQMWEYSFHLCKGQLIYSNLLHLTLNNNKITDVGAKHLSKIAFSSLNSLVLNENSIGQRGCSFLSKSQWPKITAIYLDGNKINNRGCQFLSKSWWPKCTFVSLYWNCFTVKGAIFLIKLPFDANFFLGDKNQLSSVLQQLNKRPEYSRM